MKIHGNEFCCQDHRAILLPELLCFFLMAKSVQDHVNMSQNHAVWQCRANCLQHLRLFSAFPPLSFWFTLAFPLNTCPSQSIHFVSYQEWILRHGVARADPKLLSDEWESNWQSEYSALSQQVSTESLWFLILFGGICWGNPQVTWARGIHWADCFTVLHWMGMLYGRPQSLTHRQCRSRVSGYWLLTDIVLTTEPLSGFLHCVRYKQEGEHNECYKLSQGHRGAMSKQEQRPARSQWLKKSPTRYFTTLQLQAGARASTRSTICTSVKKKFSPRQFSNSPGELRNSYHRTLGA